MASLMIDSFGHYAIGDVATKWDSKFEAFGFTFSIGTGRHSGASLHAPLVNGGGYLHKNVSPGSVGGVLGMAIKISIAPGGVIGIPLFTVLDTLTQQLTIVLTPAMKIAVFRGTAQSGTLLATSTDSLLVNAFNHVAFKFTIDPTTGTAKVRFNGSTTDQLSFTGNTRQSSNTSYNAIRVMMVELTGILQTEVLDICDFIFRDTSGSFNNDWTGDRRVDWRTVTAEGNTINGTPSTGTDNSALVDDATPNGDTDYVEFAAAGDKDTYVLQNTPVSGAVLGEFQVSIYAKKTDAGACELTSVLRSGGGPTDYDHPAPRTPTTSYQYHLFHYDTDPATSALILEAQFDALEVGVKKTI